MWRYLLIIAIFALWAVYASKYFVCEIQGNCVPPPGNIDTTALKNRPSTLGLTSGPKIIYENFPQFAFDYASSGPILVDGNRHFLARVTEHLQENKEDRLLIIGRYLESEQEAVEDKELYEDLGKARALTIAEKLRSEYKIPMRRIKTESEMVMAAELPEPLKFEILRPHNRPDSIPAPLPPDS